MSRDSVFEPLFPSLRYPDDLVQNFLRLGALGTSVSKAGLHEGASLRLYVQVKLKRTSKAILVSSIRMTFVSQPGDFLPYNSRLPTAYFQG